MIREAVQAGTFYASSREACLRDLDALLGSASCEAPNPDRVIGGIVPHAGWAYSGRVAARVFQAVAEQRSPATFVIFGAVHRPMRPVAAVFARGAWSTPLGEIAIDERLAERILSQTTLVEEDPHAHAQEHSIEVQIPLIQRWFPDAKFVPIMVRLTDEAHEVGRAVGRTVASYGNDVAFIGSTDLTHYGRGFGFAPKGSGPQGLRWAKEVNDRRAIEHMLALRAEAVVPESQSNSNACGAGAVAATIAASLELGATEGRLLEHTTSAEVAPTSSATDGAVGYAGIVFV